MIKKHLHPTRTQPGEEGSAEGDTRAADRDVEGDDHDDDDDGDDDDDDDGSNAQHDNVQGDAVASQRDVEGDADADDGSGSDGSEKKSPRCSRCLADLKGLKVGSENTKATLLMSVTLIAVLWEPAFTLGAYGVIFFDALLTIAFLSITLFLCSILCKSYPQPHPWSIVALAVFPAFLLAPTFRIEPSQLALEIVITVINIVIVFAAGALVALSLASLFFPETSGLSRQDKVLVGFTVAPVAALSFIVGFFNRAFLNCEDFQTAGWDEPSNCYRGGWDGIR